MAKNRAPAAADHLSGKRRWKRQPRTIDVVCIGLGSTIHARTIDISRGGMLVEAKGAEVAPSAVDLVPMAQLVAVAFADGLTAVLAPDLSLPADIIRVTTNPTDRGFLRLGCRFRRSLTSEECAQIGIDEADIVDPALDLEPDFKVRVRPSIARGKSASVNRPVGNDKGDAWKNSD